MQKNIIWQIKKGVHFQGQGGVKGEPDCDTGTLLRLSEEVRPVWVTVGVGKPLG